MHHLLNNKAEVNQRDEKGMTPLHRAAFLAQYDGYLELYEYLLVSFNVCSHGRAPAPACRRDTHAGRHMMAHTCHSLLLDRRRGLLLGPPNSIERPKLYYMSINSSNLTLNAVVIPTQSRGADPSTRTEDYDPYLNPGHHLPIDIACEDEAVRTKLLALDKKYAATPKVRALPLGAVHAPLRRRSCSTCPGFSS